MQNLRLTDRVRTDAGETPSQSRRMQSQRLVQQWQTLNVTPGEFQGLRAKAILAEILRLCEPMVRQFLLQMLAESSLRDLDDLVNLTLCRIESKLSTYDATKSSFESWIKYQCVRPIFKQHLEEIGYRTVKIEIYIAALQARLNGLQLPPTNLIGRLVEGLDPSQLRSEILKMRQMADTGRKVILRRDPRLIPALSLNCPIRPGAEKEEFLDVPAAVKPLDIEDTCREILHQSLSCLTAGERMVVTGLFFGNRTRKELADEAGISSARISQLLHQAYKRLREVLSPTFFRDCLPDD
jgi:RNA polymerase sigma factor FliA